MSNRGVPAPVAAGAAAPAWAGLLCCASCGGALRQAASGALACTACGQAVSVRDGIVDFVAGSAGTALDEIDYDARYAVNIGAAAQLFDVIVAAAGARWPAAFGDALEIGCGTGGFSMAFLSRAPVDRALLTDVSVKMLTTCRTRLQRMHGLLHASALDYATYSGTEACFAPAAFDTCYGTAVLHHIIDVPQVLRHIHTLLRPGGRAFFLEPAQPFHHALTAAIADVLARWNRSGAVPEDQMVRIANWAAEIHINVVNTGDVAVLADREDKHQFIAADLESMGQEAGFAVSEALPAGPDPEGRGTVGVYLGQLGLTEATFERLWEVWPTAQRRHFAALAPGEQAPSYVFWLEKGRRRRKVRPAAPPTSPPLVLGPEPLRLWLELRLEVRDDGMLLTVSGWCVAVQRLKSVELTIGSHAVRLPIWVARLDVLQAVNGDGVYPNLHALCSGIGGDVSLRGAVLGGLQVAVAVVAFEGGRLPIETVTLAAGGPAQTINVSIRAGDR